ncbi:helix-turn-helix domain-containing protein [Senimuribacter intestinalis]|uniref:helix-turn-helix domain-containing protein n=1 Tax=Senimuribacter intestinalis TaxID=2941507 RepID=UPI00204010D9|nr:helix-turn-helix transcriptional regulator [Senimuribacter intestinalis]
MYEKFELLLKNRKLSTYKVCKETGLNKSMFSHWKAGRYAPKVDKLKILADYFGVSIEYFLEE